MFNTDLSRRFAALICTVVMSTTCIVAAVGPAHAGLTARTSAATLIV